MNKKITILIIAAGILFTAGNITAKDNDKQDAPKGKAQIDCPVMGGKINKSLYVDTHGKRIYVCCAGCLKSLKANPEKYRKELEAKGIILENAPADKPASDGKPTKESKPAEPDHKHNQG